MCEYFGCVFENIIAGTETNDVCTLILAFRVIRPTFQFLFIIQYVQVDLKDITVGFSIFDSVVRP